MTQDQGFNGFVFLDIETTGLEPHHDEILEVGIVLYNEQFEEVDAKNWVIANEETKAALRKTFASEDVGDKYVAAMHKASGLAEELLGVSSSEHNTTRFYMLDIIDWLSERDAILQPMCGSSIGSLDRPFLKHHMTELNEAFHYRSIDTSGFKEFTRRVAPDLWKVVEAATPSTGTVHRALDDCRYSATLLSNYWAAIRPL